MDWIRAKLRWICIGLALTLVSGGIALASDSAMGAIWINRDVQPAMDLDGDGEYDVVEYLYQNEDCILAFRFGNGNVFGHMIGVSTALEMTKIDAADVTGDGKREIIFMVYDRDQASFELHVLEIKPDELLALPVFDLTASEAFGYQASFLRDHVLQIRSRDDSFFQNIALDSQRFGGVYREDGTVTASEIIHVSGFQNFSITPYSVGYAVDLRQALSYGPNEVILGYMVTTLVWRGEDAYLVGQRFEKI